MQTHVRSGIAYQIKALREKFSQSQDQFAGKTGKPQSVISRLENTEYGKVTVQTLLDIATSLDVALLVRFVSYPEFLNRTSDMSTKALQPDTISESLNSESQNMALWPASSYEGNLARVLSSGNNSNLTPQRPERALRQIGQVMEHQKWNLPIGTEDRAQILKQGVH